MGLLTRLVNAIPEEDNLDLPAPAFNQGIKQAQPRADAEFQNIIPHAQVDRDITYTVSHTISNNETSKLGSSQKTSIAMLLIKIVACVLGSLIAIPFFLFIIFGVSQ